ncbi:DNA polymerase III subunit delta' [Siminovitchia sediminis]|uniref:DNA polymerase III subunit delta' n=1 Tax=Siminovitchia sediminis TaxID=1274353 RepID=A0ABW4KMT9_9BACI
MNWHQFEKDQPIAARLLKNSLEHHRIAHAYLFEGDHGTGKKAGSLLMAASLFCEESGQNVNPCGHCTNCKRINSGNHPDVHHVEPDGFSIKIDQIRALRTEFSKSGMESSRKLYIIKDAEKMTVQAANSLLKFLEEPHSGTTAVLITEQPQQLLPTIISRCQSVPFFSLTPEQFAKKLEEAGVLKGKTALLSMITNDLQEALRLSDDDWFAQARKIVLKLYEAMKQNSLYAMISIQTEWLGHFKEKAQHELGLSLLLYIYKDMLNIQLGKDRQLIYPDQREMLERDALHTSMKRLSDQMTAILEAKRKLHANMNPQLLMEQLVLNLQGGPSFV